MDTILNIINQFSDFIWTYPMPVLLVSLGIWLTIKFRFKYQLNFRFNIKNTYGGLFKKKMPVNKFRGRAQYPVLPPPVPRWRIPWVSAVSAGWQPRLRWAGGRDILALVFCFFRNCDQSL